MKRHVRLMVTVPRLLAALAFAAALVAIPVASPQDAGAQPMSEQKVSRYCSNGGGSIHYEFYGQDFTVWEMTCTYPSGHSWTCGGEVLGSMVDC